MVKNNTGGNKSRQQGRKFKAVGEVTNTAVRRVREDGEMYGAVTRMFGGKFCQVIGTDGVLRRCAIRKKFSQRRSQNNLTAGVWVLLGLYDWNNKDKDKDTNTKSSATPVSVCSCDLLEIYNPGEKERLKQLEKDCNFGPLLAVGETKEVSFSGYNPNDVDAPKLDEDQVTSDRSDNDTDTDVEDNTSGQPHKRTGQQALATQALATQALASQASMATEYKKPTLQDQMDWINEDDI